MVTTAIFTGHGAYFMTQGILYIVATPIGNLDDITLRALQILQRVDLIAAEDTRHSGHLLKHFTINTPLISLHEHNEAQRCTELFDALQQGKSIALISDAGTPLISDPGYTLVMRARSNDIKVVPIPGACALITALSAAGLAADHFVFEGFLPSKQGARLKHLQTLRDETRTLIFYEAPHRIVALLQDMIQVFGTTRYGVLARELTKLFETFQTGELATLLERLKSDPNQQKGEFVVLLKGAEAKAQDTQLQTLTLLDTLLSELPISQAVSLAAKITGEKKNWLYETALERKKPS